MNSATLNNELSYTYTFILILIGLCVLYSLITIAYNVIIELSKDVVVDDTHELKHQARKEFDDAYSKYVAGYSKTPLLDMWNPKQEDL